MKLIPDEVKLKEIMIDPFNPRFTNVKTFEQDSLINEMLRSKSSKELLNSMQEDIKWVNRIVIQKIDTHYHNEMLSKFKRDYKFIVVEGNTRLSCLKSGAIKDYNEDTSIPVLLAEKDVDETPAEFNKEIRITQGIANVTVVKEWSQVAKAKHLNELFNDLIKTKKAPEVYKQLSVELGINLKEVRELIIRFKIFNKICEISDPINDEDWGYLEAFDKNLTIRKIIGMNPETNEFMTNVEEEYFEEILSDIPNLIRQAHLQGLNTKQFRDIIVDVSKSNTTSEEFNIVVKDILDINSDTSLVSLKNNLKIKSDKDQWDEDLKGISEKISAFPIIADWAAELKERLEKIKEKVDKHLKIISSS